MHLLNNERLVHSASLLLHQQLESSSFARRKLLIGPFLLQLAAVEHYDPVGIAHGREAVGNDERRAALHAGFERRLNVRLRSCVQRRRRFVEQ